MSKVIYTNKLKEDFVVNDGVRRTVYYFRLVAPPEATILARRIDISIEDTSLWVSFKGSVSFTDTSFTLDGAYLLLEMICNPKSGNKNRFFG